MKIPVTIITGYLGAGKTTLLRKIISETKMKIAILMNEFGQIGIDGKVIQGKNIKITELAGGCVCCSLAGELEAAMAEIIETIKPDWMIVETTGVAEPSALAYDVMENIKGTRLDAIVTIVDSDALARFVSLGHTGAEQIELADVIIINKKDLVGEEKLEEIKQKLTGMNSRAVLIESAFCTIDLEFIFGLNRKDVPAVAHKHQMEFEYFDYTTDKKFDYDRIVTLFANLPTEIYRSKGFVMTNRGSFLINQVGGRFNCEEFEAKKTELVFIGKQIAQKKEKTEEALNQCII